MTNDAVERLLHRIDMIGEAHNIDMDMKSYEKDLDEALAAERRPLIEALIWMSGSDDFAPGGKAREGFEKIVKPLLDAEAER